MFASDSTVNRLKGITLLRDVRGRDRKHLARHLDQIQLAPGTTLIEQGTLNRHAYFVLSGTLAVEVDGNMVATVGADTIVGEATALGNREANATVVAAEDTVVLAINHRALVALMLEKPGLGERLRSLVDERSAA